MINMFSRNVYNFNHKDFTLFIYNNNADVSGGILTVEDIDKISDYPDETQIKIMGLNQEMFEYFIDNYGKQFKKIFFWKNKRIEDLTPLSQLPNLEEVYFFFNQRVTKLWDMTNNKSLHTLCIEDFSRLKDLENIDTAPTLTNFYRGDAIWDSALIESLKPLEKSNIEVLGFSCKKLVDEDIEPLVNMKSLKYLYCQPNRFPVEKCVEFSLRRPDVKGYISTPYIDWGNDYVRVVGKRKPMLSKTTDEQKLQRYIDNWNEIADKIQGEFKL